jgi:hypothetical protein
MRCGEGDAAASHVTFESLEAMTLHFAVQLKVNGGRTRSATYGPVMSEGKVRRVKDVFSENRRVHWQVAEVV